MHSPESVAHEIHLPFYKDKHGHKRVLITIWHNDPEKDGTDDSCGRFIRARHADQKILAKIKSEFDFNFLHNYWFDKSGKQKFSTSGILLQMYKVAAWQHFKHNRDKSDKFFRKHLHDILSFAENEIDCGGDNITNRWNEPNFNNRMEGMASMVYTDILRKIRPWYKHPKWHINHWGFQIHPLQQFKRRFWDKCCVCGKRGFKGSAMSDWGGKRIWHEECNISPKQQERHKKLENLVK